MAKRYIRWFKDLSIDDTALVGGKNASLGEMYRELSAAGVRVPNGFAVTAQAYRDVLEANGAWARLRETLADLDPDDIQSLQVKGRQAREIVSSCELPEPIVEGIKTAYAELRREYGDDIRLAVRSSATAEDSPDASFAGQNDSFLNVQGVDGMLDAYRRCLASNFSDRSLHYKHDNRFDPFKVDICVVIMKMVRSDLATSGVMFSLDTETGFRDTVFINACYGLGENIVQGTIDPDSFHVHKPTYQRGRRGVLKRRLGSKEKRMILTEAMGGENLVMERTVNVETSPEDQARFCLEDDEVLQLADYAIKIEHHFTVRAGKPRPMDMEWAKDGGDGKLYIVQARPETVESRHDQRILETYVLKERSKVLVSGQAVGGRIGSGAAHYIRDTGQLGDFKAGEVLVADVTSPDWEPIMKVASAIITNRGGRTCHAAIVARELGIPAIVGARNATERLPGGRIVTVSCAEGETGAVYDGELEFAIEKTDLSDLPKTRTEIMMNLGNPDIAFSLAGLPVDGIGLARMEFIIGEYIKAHPMAFLHPERVDEGERAKVAAMACSYDDGKDFFVKTLAEGIATLAAAVYPKPCVVRTSDFKSNEYAALVGGRAFEPDEENPMIGFRGAIRYSHPDYSEAFALECSALRRAREVIGLDNIIVMIPFCRRVEEAHKVLATLARNGLERGIRGLQVYMMCEIPNNVIQIDAFSACFDGFSIGSNDLTQLTLGVDRDNGIIAEDYDERDPGVLEMIRLAVEGCKRNGRHSGICGQGPSDYPELAEFLVQHGVDSISLNPDSVLATIARIAKIEKGT